MYRVHVHLVNGEKLRSFKAREFDIDLDKQSEAGARKFTYTDPDSGEERIYLNPKEVAAIELRPTRESARSKVEETADRGQAQSDYQYYKPLPEVPYKKKSLLSIEEGETSPEGSKSRRTWMPPEDSDAKDGSTEDQDSPMA
jgi:hypothetical protein